MLPRMWDAEKNDLLKASEDQLEFAITALKGHPAYTLFHDSAPVASFGVVVNGDQGEAWTWFTPDVRACKADFERILGEHLSMIVDDYGLLAVHCGVIKGYEHKMPWVERLGFERLGETDEQVRYQLWPSSPQS